MEKENSVLESVYNRNFYLSSSVVTVNYLGIRVSGTLDDFIVYSTLTFPFMIHNFMGLIGFLSASDPQSE